LKSVLFYITLHYNYWALPETMVSIWDKGVYFSCSGESETPRLATCYLRHNCLPMGDYWDNGVYFTCSGDSETPRWTMCYLRHSCLPIGDYWALPETMVSISPHLQWWEWDSKVGNVLPETQLSTYRRLLGSSWDNGIYFTSPVVVRVRHQGGQSGNVLPETQLSTYRRLLGSTSEKGVYFTCSGECDTKVGNVFSRQW